jgi:hypothetical protein
MTISPEQFEPFLAHLEEQTGIKYGPRNIRLPNGLSLPAMHYSGFGRDLPEGMNTGVTSVMPLENGSVFRSTATIHSDMFHNNRPTTRLVFKQEEGHDPDGFTRRDNPGRLAYRTPGAYGPWLPTTAGSIDEWSDQVAESIADAPSSDRDHADRVMQVQGERTGNGMYLPVWMTGMDVDRFGDDTVNFDLRGR